MRHLPQLPLENKSMPIASHPKMKMWGQEELLRCWVGQRNHKSDFGETNPILPQAQETKTHLSAMTIYFRTKPILPRAIRDGDLKSLSTTKLNHDARIVGETTGDAGAGSWFLTNVARSVGWHKGTVKVGPALVDNTNQVDFSVDDILALSHNSKTAFGYNV